ncbi:MAG: hypothetical protein CR997_05055 [Acidobacteria bacterium]|nr:MAG: hypothetical protein CR997_05055 [Acidobacteriota bacterium]
MGIWFMNYYRILDVSRNCSVEELRRAFRRLSLKAHPDRFQGNDKHKAEKEYQFLVKAYNVLKDPDQRKKYDQSLENGTASGHSQHSQANQLEEGKQYEKAGVALYHRGEYPLAVEYLNKAAYVIPGANIYFYKGLAESKVPGKKKMAIQSLQKAVEYDAYQVKYRLALISCLFEMGLKTKASIALKEAKMFFPSDSNLLDLEKKIFKSLEKKEGLVKGFFSAFRGKS